MHMFVWIVHLINFKLAPFGRVGLRQVHLGQVELWRLKLGDRRCLEARRVQLGRVELGDREGRRLVVETPRDGAGEEGTADMGARLGVAMRGRGGGVP